MTNDTNAAPLGLGALSEIETMTDAQWHAREAERDARIDAAGRRDTRQEFREGLAAGVFGVGIAAFVVCAGCHPLVAVIACGVAMGGACWFFEVFGRMTAPAWYAAGDKAGAEGDE